MGLSTSMAGQEGVLAVASPMARTLDDLVYFSKAIWGMKPERYDHTVHPIPWREDDYQAIKKKSRLRIGIMRTDGTTPLLSPSPFSFPQTPIAMPPRTTTNRNPPSHQASSTPPPP